MKKTSIGTSWIKMVSMKIDNDTRIRKVLTVYSQNDFSRVKYWWELQGVGVYFKLVIWYMYHTDWKSLTTFLG